MSKNRTYVEMKNNVKKFRLEKGLTQLELAQKSNTKQNTISAIEREEYLPSIYLAGLISIALEHKIDEVFYFEFKEDNKI